MFKDIFRLFSFWIIISTYHLEKFLFCVLFYFISCLTKQSQDFIVLQCTSLYFIVLHCTSLYFIVFIVFIVFHCIHCICLNFYISGLLVFSVPVNSAVFLINFNFIHYIFLPKDFGLSLPNVINRFTESGLKFCFTELGFHNWFDFFFSSWCFHLMLNICSLIVSLFVVLIRVQPRFYLIS